MLRHAKLLQSCPALCDSMNCSLPGFSVHGIFQARKLEWVTIFYSGGSSRPRDPTSISYVSCIGRRVLYHLHHQGSHDWLKSLSHVRLFGTPWAVACQVPLSMGFSRQEYWSGLPFQAWVKYPSLNCWSFIGQEPGGPELTMREWKKERG